MFQIFITRCEKVLLPLTKCDVFQFFVQDVKSVSRFSPKCKYSFLFSDQMLKKSNFLIMILNLFHFFLQNPESVVFGQDVKNVRPESKFFFLHLCANFGRVSQIVCKIVVLFQVVF